MTKTTITVRVDAETKKQAEKACEHLGITLTSVVHLALRNVIHQSTEFNNLLSKYDATNLVFFTPEEKKRLIKALRGDSND